MGLEEEDDDVAESCDEQDIHGHRPTGIGGSACGKSCLKAPWDDNSCSGPAKRGADLSLGETSSGCGIAGDGDVLPGDAH